MDLAPVNVDSQLAPRSLQSTAAVADAPSASLAGRRQGVCSATENSAAFGICTDLDRLTIQGRVQARSAEPAGAFDLWLAKSRFMKGLKAHSKRE